jgi:hypothetical protein
VSSEGNILCGAAQAIRATSERLPTKAHPVADALSHDEDSDDDDDDQPFAKRGCAYTSAPHCKAEAALDSRRDMESTGSTRQVGQKNAGLQRQRSVADAGFQLEYRVLTETEAQDLLGAVISGMRCSARNMTAGSALAARPGMLGLQQGSTLYLLCAGESSLPSRS